MKARHRTDHHKEKLTISFATNVVQHNRSLLAAVSWLRGS